MDDTDSSRHPDRRLDRARFRCALVVSIAFFTLAILGVQLVATAAAGLHKWVSQRESEPQLRRQSDRELQKLEKRQEAIEKRMDDHDDRSSHAMSRIQDRIAQIELDMREIKTRQSMHGSAGV